MDLSNRGRGAPHNVVVPRNPLGYVVEADMSLQWHVKVQEEWITCFVMSFLGVVAVVPPFAIHAQEWKMEGLSVRSCRRLWVVNHLLQASRGSKHCGYVGCSWRAGPVSS